LRTILPQAYTRYSEDKIFRVTPRLAEKAIIQDALQLIVSGNHIQKIRPEEAEQ
jgi:hypothetical protein